MSEPALYLAFPDGVLHYVCVECDARCCRGHGMGGNMNHELRPLLTKYPALGALALQRRGSLLDLATPAGGCLFLQGDNWCRIEVQQGKAAKPAVCNLFPFNAFTRIGNTMAVAPHFLCPLRVQVPAPPGQVEGSHARVAAAVRSSRLLDEFQLQAGAALEPSEDADSVVARETHFRDLCGAAIGREPFAAAVGRAFVAPARQEQLQRALALLLLAPRESETPDALDAIFFAIAPSLRLKLLHLKSDAILVTLLLAEQSVRRLAELAAAPLVPQAVYHLIDSLLPALRLLALGDEPMGLPQSAVKEASQMGEAPLVFAQFKILRGAEEGRPILLNLEENLHRVPELVDRTALLMEIGRRVDQARMKPGRRRRTAKS